MARIGFDKNTVRDLMSIVDEGKETISEMEYVRICNAMKFLHERTTQPVPTISESHPLSLAVSRWERRVRKLERYIEYSKPVHNNVKNVHRQHAIEEILPHIILEWRGPRNGIIKMKNSDIKKYFDYIINEGLIDIQKFKEKCYNNMIIECENNIRSLTLDLDVARSRLEDAKQDLESLIDLGRLH
jgi:polyhydroxyalkanoate synthesis regulator phasin